MRGDPERTARPFAEQLAELLGYFDPPADQRVRAIPAPGNAPPVWLLGSSTFSAQLAGELGLPYAFAHHLHPERVAAALRLYRESFRPSPRLPDPFVLVSVSAVVADSDDHAHWLAGPNRLKALSRGLGRRILLPTPEEAAAFPYTDEDRAKLEEWFASHVIGSPDTVAKGLQQLLDETAADELMVTTKVHDHADRRQSFELLAGLTG